MRNEKGAARGVMAEAAAGALAAVFVFHAWKHLPPFVVRLLSYAAASALLTLLVCLALDERKRRTRPRRRLTRAPSVAREASVAEVEEEEHVDGEDAILLVATKTVRACCAIVKASEASGAPAVLGEEVDLGMLHVISFELNCSADRLFADLWADDDDAAPAAAQTLAALAPPQNGAPQAAGLPAAAAAPHDKAARPMSLPVALHGSQAKSLKREVSANSVVAPAVQAVPRKSLKKETNKGSADPAEAETSGTFYVRFLLEHMTNEKSRASAWRWTDGDPAAVSAAAAVSPASAPAPKKKERHARRRVSTLHPIASGFKFPGISFAIPTVKQQRVFFDRTSDGLDLSLAVTELQMFEHIPYAAALKVQTVLLFRRRGAKVAVDVYYRCVFAVEIPIPRWIQRFCVAKTKGELEVTFGKWRDAANNRLKAKANPAPATPATFAANDVSTPPKEPPATPSKDAKTPAKTPFKEPFKELSKALAKVAHKEPPKTAVTPKAAVVVKPAVVKAPAVAKTPVVVKAVVKEPLKAPSPKEPKEEPKAPANLQPKARFKEPEPVPEAAPVPREALPAALNALLPKALGQRPVRHTKDLCNPLEAVVRMTDAFVQLHHRTHDHRRVAAPPTDPAHHRESLRLQLAAQRGTAAPIFCSADGCAPLFGGDSSPSIAAPKKLAAADDDAQSMDDGSTDEEPDPLQAALPKLKKNSRKRLASLLHLTRLNKKQPARFAPPPDGDDLRASERPPPEAHESAPAEAPSAADAPAAALQAALSHVLSHRHAAFENEWCKEDGSDDELDTEQHNEDPYIAAGVL
ncbi:hypothetical protein M885DRAFT_512666 [Pelagophyceae sp. CCMP2097]|nr:hypothetical protein M885DRAFT_512666 [Pelagophyceae sp. CCMP2097]